MFMLIGKQKYDIDYIFLYDYMQYLHKKGIVYVPNTSF